MLCTSLKENKHNFSIRHANEGRLLPNERLNNVHVYTVSWCILYRTVNYKLIMTPLDIAFMNAISTRRLKIGCIHSID